MTEPQPMSDADLLAWSVVLAYRGLQQKQGLTILLLPFPPCPTCGGVVHGADSVTVERGIEREASLTLRPCGHVHASVDSGQTATEATEAATFPARDRGPTVREAAADDRAHWNTKYAGEGS